VTMARATHRDGGTHLGAAGKRVITGELVRGDVGRWRGMAVVEVDHGPGEAARWTVRSTERLRSSKRWRQGRKIVGVARPRWHSSVKMEVAPDVAELMGERGGDEVGEGSSSQSRRVDKVNGRRTWPAALGSSVHGRQLSRAHEASDRVAG
jgi:hypothetical protein